MEATAAAGEDALGASDLRAVVLVEGASDRSAVETLARRRGRDLAADGVAVVAMDGITNIGRFLARFGPPGLGLRVAGLYDAAEERVVRRGLARAGVEVAPAPGALEQVGFHRCVPDLEAELIRALGVPAVEEVIAARHELRSLRILQNQPAQRGRAGEDQVRRFLGSRGGRKILYARLLVEALDLDRVPPPLDAVLGRV